MRAAVWLVGALGSALAGAASGVEQGPADRIQFAVSVETVTLDVVVIDKRGRFVPNLKAESFEVFEDGERQELSFFTSQFTPVRTMLLLDSSSSIRSNLSAIQTAGYLFVRNLSEGDTARIGLFNSDVRFGASFTDDVNEHFTVLRSMKPAGKTALYDALLSAFGELDRLEGRRSLLLFTDGDDAGPAEQGSTAPMEEALEKAKLSEVTIYTVGFTGWGPDGSYSVNRPFLTSLAESTGGRAFFPEDVEQVKAAFAEVQEDLHRHYRLAYMPTRGLGKDDAAWRQLRVNVKDRQELRVRTRQGYYPRRKEPK
ncbi:MAG TPA: VWA domain-containing protein [Vicinamibacteria bacterium]|nr:VWA domain-containing protein [Vicinamibacteria bacterium]